MADQFQQLAMGILGGLFGGIYLSTRGGGKKITSTPPIQAASKDEENFIQYGSNFSLYLGSTDNRAQGFLEGGRREAGSSLEMYC